MSPTLPTSPPVCLSFAQHVLPASTSVSFMTDDMCLDLRSSHLDSLEGNAHDITR